jgi:diacylglycerol O-acyltransferase / wax synthase
LGDKLPPMSNAMVSNVPGPNEYLYIKSARMEEMHPISTLPPSNRLNVTLFSYAGTLYFGLVADDGLPDLRRLGSYVEKAFAELEDCILK